MSRGRVAMVSTGHPATDHRIFEKEARTLAEAGYEVEVVALQERAETRDGVRIVPLPVREGRLDRFARRPWRALRLIRRGGPPAVVHIHDAELLQICPVLKLGGRSRVVYDVHEDFANLMLHRDWIPRPLRAGVRALVRGGEALLARSCDAIVAATGSLAENFPSHRRVALYNLPTQEFVSRAGEGAMPPSTRPVDVLHVGVLSSERLAFLVATLRSLLERRPETGVRLIGLPAPQREQIRNELSDAVEILGRVPYDEIAGLVQECRVGVNVHPFMYPHLQVALPVKVLEYMAAGCGVVTSHLPELHARLSPETLGHISTVREPEPPAYARAIAGWLDAPERLDAASEHLRRAAREQYSWDSQAPKLRALYDDLLEPGEAT